MKIPEGYSVAKDRYDGTFNVTKNNRIVASGFENETELDNFFEEQLKKDEKIKNSPFNYPKNMNKQLGELKNKYKSFKDYIN